MKNNVVLPLGGELTPGDVVAIAYNNYNVFGWYVGPGTTGSLQYIMFQAPERARTQYEEYLKEQDPRQWQLRKYHKGFVFKNVSKDYILTWDHNRAFKIPNPEEFFDGSAIGLIYKQGKEILNQLKFPAK